MKARSMGARRGLIVLTEALGRDGGRPAIAVVMACLTFLAALLAAFQGDAATAAARSERAADAWALERTGFDASTHVAGLRDANVFRQWFALLEEAEWARGTGDATPPDEAALREALARIDAELAEWIRGQSAMLQPPYFDAATNLVDFNAFSAQSMADSFRATEMTRVENDAADDHEAKAAGYVTVLAIVAVALFFLGLAATVASRARRVLVAAGVGLGTVAMAATLLIAAGTAHRVPDPAVEAVVASMVDLQAAGAGEPLLLTDARRPRYTAAIEQARLAATIDPSFVSAHRALGEARLFFANARLFGGEGMSDETRALIEDGIRAYERALELDDGDRNTWWNLGFARYLVGDPEGAAAATAEVIARSPGEFAPYVNLALAELAAGRRDEAWAWVDRGLAVAATSNHDTTRAFFDQIDGNLGRLAGIRDEERDELLAIQRRMREAHVAMRIGRGVDVDASAPSVSEVGVVGLSLQARGTFEELAAVADGATASRAGLSGVRLTVRGAALAGHTVSARVWANGRIDAGYARDVVADGDEVTIDLVDPYGRAGFLLAPGSWLIEIYVDGATRGSRSFEVVSEG